MENVIILQIFEFYPVASRFFFFLSSLQLTFVEQIRDLPF